MKLFLALAIFLFSLGMAQAQEVELTGAYQFNRFEAGAFGFTGSTNAPAGASANINFPVNQWLGVTGDVGWAQKSLSESGITATARLWTYGGGPQFTYRKDDRLQPFLRMTIGAGTLSGNVSQVGSASSTAFMFGPGGGLDARLSRHFWVRAGIDYFHGDKQGVSLNTFQVVAGIQLRFGGKASESQASRTVSPASDSIQPSATLAASDSLLAIARLGLSAYSAKNGAEIMQMLSGSPAAQSGLQIGDVINLIGGKRVRTSQELAAEISAAKPGETIEVGYLIRGMWQAKTSLTIPAP